MAAEDYQVDPDLLVGFVDEALDSLSALDTEFVTLEQSPNDQDVLNAIFRPIHSIKGNAAFFGLLKVKTLAHEMETVLDCARKGEYTPGAHAIDVLLQGMDLLQAMMRRARHLEPELEDEVEFEKLLETVVALLGEDASDAKWPELVEVLETLQFVVGQSEGMGQEEVVRALELVQELMPEQHKNAEQTVNGPADVQRLNELLLKGQKADLNDADADEVGKLFESIHSQLSLGEALDIVAQALDEYQTMVPTVGFDTLLADILLGRLNALVELAPWGDEVPVEEVKAAEPATKAKAPAEPAHAAEASRTMRVSEDSIDQFLSYVGELIVVGEMFEHVQKRVAQQSKSEEGRFYQDIAKDLQRANETFTELFTDLRKSIMEIRKVPVRQLLQKVPRIVRDVAAEAEKDIAVILGGEDIQIDKRLIDVLESPLTHMVRNAADHGIESGEDRLAQGKDEQGTVHVTVEEGSDDLFVIIKDDGKGLDRDKLVQKALDKGLIKKGEELSDEAVFNLIFHPGLSTAKTVTDISGRGVGMDVVKRAIEDAGGKIRIQSEPGVGSEFRIQLPKSVSTQIIDGFMFQVGQNTCILPIDCIQEAFLPAPSDCLTVLGKGECVRRHGDTLPVLRLSELFGHGYRVKSVTEQGIMVSVSDGKHKLALHVDQILGGQQAVIKPLVGVHADLNLFAGSAIMGNGHVALILDADFLYNINTTPMAG